MNTWYKGTEIGGEWKTAVLAAVLLLTVTVSHAQPTSRAARDAQLDKDIHGLAATRALLKKSDRPIRVLAQLSEATVQDGGSAARTAQMSGISQARLSSATQKAVDMLKDKEITQVQAIEGLPLVTFVLKRSQLTALAESGQFASVVEDKLAKPYLASSGNVIDVPALHAMGASGAGQTVAILDTGVDIDHPFLNGRVVEGACYSSNVAEHGATSLCPGGAESATTPASGNHCSGVNGCDHGTHVAGIAAGRATDSINLTGVAPDAEIMAVQVFSRFDDVAGGPATCASVGTTSPCILSYTSDQIRGLQRVLNRANELNVVSVNMSLGGGEFTATCDAEDAAQKSIIDQLLDGDTATVIASGNDGFRSAIGSPACISSAVAVGSTTDADDVSSFSNMSDTVDLLAPGSSIDSSVPGTGFANFDGTSMATPQVAGAIAALASCSNNPNVADILAALGASGVSVTDGRPGGTVTKNRIELDAAAALACGSSGSDPDQDCIDHNLDNLQLQSRGWWLWRTWTIVDGNRRLFSFGRNRAEGQATLDIIRQFAFTNTCYIGRPDASMQYLRAGNTVPGGAHGSVDCLSFNRANTRIESADSGQWRLTDGASRMLVFPNQAEAQQALDVINKHSLNRQCYVGRPDPSFTFWLSN